VIEKFSRFVIGMTATFLTSTVLAASQEPKHTMKSNSQVVYNEVPSSVESLSKMFSEGKFYGRLRSNTFYFWWDKEDTVNHDIHLISGLGGSLVYKSATFSGFDFGAALYYTKAFYEDKEDFLTGWKAGKDTASRYNIAKTGSKNLAVLGQAFMRYQPTNNSEIIVGRQIVESFYTKSNDTKMIPNTFDGIVIDTQDIPSTSFKLAYLAKQKLRDHAESHSVLMRGDCVSDNCSDPDDINQKIVASWSENDDSAMHKGLTYSALKAANKPTDAPLVTGDFRNYSIDGLALDASFYVVPELLSHVMSEVNYEVKFDGFSISPGVRYIKQFDLGAGEAGGASLSGQSVADNYDNPNSLESQMIGARVVTRFSEYKINLAYTHIFDEADLVTPWRGFSTSGYTRSMARYNWRANTKSYRAEFVKSSSDIGLYHDIFMQISLLYQDDDNKANALGINTDSLYYYAGFMQNIEFLDNAQWRYRVGYQDFIKSGSLNNLDTRFELNYLF